jgi:uncharacterized protein YuzB (UPF0349 family)
MFKSIFAVACLAHATKAEETTYVSVDGEVFVGEAE